MEDDDGTALLTTASSYSEVLNDDDSQKEDYHPNNNDHDKKEMMTKETKAKGGKETYSLTMNSNVFAMPFRPYKRHNKKKVKQSSHYIPCKILDSREN